MYNLGYMNVTFVTIRFQVCEILDKSLAFFNVLMRSVALVCCRLGG